MDCYYSLKDHQTETVISRSRFITFLFNIQSEDEAAEKLKELNKKYSDATHICYAYVADKTGNTARFSDDGEPSGTAGKPILDAITKNGYKQVLVAVVRYFGGVKLGAGGLTRAYGGCAAEVLDKAAKIRYVLSSVYSVTADFNAAERLKKHFADYKILDIFYTDCVNITVAVPNDINLQQTVMDLSSGKAEIKKIKTDYIIFD